MSPVPVTGQVVMDSSSVGVIPVEDSNRAGSPHPPGVFNKAVSILSELEQLCNRVVVLEAGRVRYDGALAEFRAQRGGERAVRLRLVEEEARPAARALLEAQPTVSELQEGAPAELRFQVRGEPAEVATLHRALVEAGLGVYAFEVEELGLESLFLQVTQGQVQ